jgi:hypothetical protein
MFHNVIFHLKLNKNERIGNEMLRMLLRFWPLQARPLNLEHLWAFALPKMSYHNFRELHRVLSLPRRQVSPFSINIEASNLTKIKHESLTFKSIKVWKWWFRAFKRNQLQRTLVNCITKKYYYFVKTVSLKFVNNANNPLNIPIIHWSQYQNTTNLYRIQNKNFNLMLISCNNKRNYWGTKTSILTTKSMDS